MATSRRGSRAELMRRNSRAASSASTSPAPDKRLRVLNEIYETERKYVDCLFTVIDIFKAPLVEARITSGDTPQNSSSSGRRASMARRASVSGMPSSSSAITPSLDRSVLEKIFSNIEQVGLIE